MVTKLRAFARYPVWAFSAWLIVSPARAETPAKTAKITPAMLAALVRQYRDLGLPLPPPDAAPLLLPMSLHADADNKPVNEYVIGFRLTPGDGKDNPGTFLVGTDVWDPSHHRTMDAPALPLDPDKPLTAALHKGVGYFATFPTEVWLSIAIQCQTRGYERLARQILERNLMHLDHWFADNRAAPEDSADPTANRFLYREINGGDPRKALAAAAWNHWLNAVVQPGTDRREASARMEKLFAGYSAFRGKERENILTSLRLTVQPSTSISGSPEAVIDALVDGTTVYVDSPIPPKGFADPNLNTLLEMGFAAMPTLIAHMDDHRLLRGVEQALDSSPYLVSVGMLVTSLVEEAAGSELFEPGTRPRVGEYDSSKLARKWWEKASKEGEEAYVRGHVFPLGKSENEYEWVNRYCLWFVARRYPQYLAGIYEQLLRERPDLGIEDVAASIAACEGLGQEEKLRLLRMGADHPQLERREEVLTILLQFDPPDAEARLIRELEHLPATASVVHYGYPPEETIAWVVQKSDSPAVWGAFERAARRVGPDLRAKLIGRIANGWPPCSPPQRAERIAFLRAFIDDEAIWHDPDKSSDQRGRAEKDKPENATHTVGNKAVEELGDFLRDHLDPDFAYADGLDAKGWARYRAAVRAELDKK